VEVASLAKAATSGCAWLVLAIIVLGLVILVVDRIFRPRYPDAPPYVKGACYTPPVGLPASTKPGFAYEAPIERRVPILEGRSLIKPGMSRADVRRILGDPDVDQPALRHLSADYHGIFWRYYLWTVEPAGSRGVNMNDAGVFVTFDVYDHVIAVNDTTLRAGI
jgi:hypothetical protein